MSLTFLSRHVYPSVFRIGSTLCLIVLVIVIGFRHEVGGDWSTYLEHLDLASQESLGFTLGLFDPGYFFFVWIASNIGGGIYFVNLICAIFFVIGLIQFCGHQPRPWLAMTIAMPYLITVVGMGYTRQAVAIGFAMLAILALLRGRTMRFVAWIVMAGLFHKSAVILLPLAALASSRNLLLTLPMVVCVGAVMFVLLIQEALTHMLTHYIEAEYQSSGAAIRVAMNALPSAIFLVLRGSFQLSELEGRFWFWMSLIGLAFVGLLLVSPSSTAVDRLALYWIPLQIFVWSRIPDALGGVGRANLLWTVLVVIYSGSVFLVWLLFADHAYLWLPYKFWLWEVIW